MTERDSGIALRGVMKTYLGVHAVREVDLDIRPGSASASSARTAQARAR